MAPRSRSATITERPRTSSGPDSRKPTADNRVSRDDLALSGRTFERANFKSYHVPIRGPAALSPDTSPNSQWQSRMATTRIATPDSMDDKATGVIAIGMALGSPAHPPETTMATRWQPQLARAATAAPDVQTPQASLDETKTKGRKWGLFGRSKSKRGKPEPGPKRSMNEVTASPAAGPSPLSSSSAARQPAQQPWEVHQSEKDKKKGLKHKPIVVRSQTEPLPNERVDPRQMRAPNPLPKDYYYTSGWSQGSGAPSGVPAKPNKGMLDVEIPDVTLERYSIMFGNLLKPRPSSLLARRQATLGKANIEKLKPISDETQQDDLHDLPRPRRATSPQPTSSPSFNLFPTPSGRTESPRRSSPRMRSNTSPALLPSPSRESFNKPRSRKPSSKTGGSTMAMVYTAKDDRAPTTSTPQDHRLPLSKFHRPSPSLGGESPVATLTESPTTIEGVHIKDKLRPVFAEPAWEMISPPASTASSSPNTSRKQSPASSTSEQTNETKPSDDEQAGKALDNAVEISIARQISVSREQRRMLGPFKAGQRKISSPGAKIPMGMNERLAETKSSTPTIVHPELDTGSPQAAMNPHRKSSMGILEGA